MLAAAMEIETNRLVIRSFSDRDVPEYAAIVADANVMRYLGGALSRDEASAYITRARHTEVAHGFARYAVIRKRDDCLIGMCGFAPVQDYVDLGYRFSRSCWGSGFASEAASAVVDLGFQRFDFETIIGLAHPDNRASLRVLEKLGFTFLRDEKTPRGIPAKRYRLTRAAWQKAGGEPPAPRGD